MPLNKTVLVIALTSMLTTSLAIADEGKSVVIGANEVNWGYLNPLRGENSPGAADLWGDRTTNSATGMLVKFKKGFQSPPHIHNISYRGIVIEGLMHNDTPLKQPMWMPAGSFWTQPAGHDHITAANASDNLIYLEIDSGPYLVQPSNEHFDNGESPINLSQSDIDWSVIKNTDSTSSQQVLITNLWGSNDKGKLGGVMIKIPAGYTANIAVNAEEFRSVIIEGDINYQSNTVTDKKLTPGSYFASGGQFNHQIASSQGATLYIRTNGIFSIN